MAAQGLVNGANGTVIGFKANNKTIDTQGEQNPDEILVLFDDTFFKNLTSISQFQ